MPFASQDRVNQEPAFDQSGDHFVQFYDSDDFLIETVCDFIGEALRRGASGLVIATQSHRTRIEKALKLREMDPVALQERYCAMDAAETLDKFMAGGHPNPERFRETLGRVLSDMQNGRQPLWAFGEMVALLAAAGNHGAAVELEQLWNDLAKSYSFKLLCAYPMRDLVGEANSAAFAEICGCHSQAIPTESIRLLSSPQRLEAISELEQKARSLELEIARREKLEMDLKRRERELSDFLENAVEGLHKVAADGSILWANRAELELLGYAAEEYIGRQIADFHADPEVIADILARLGRGEALHDYPARLLAKGGTVKHVLITSNANFEDGRFLYSRCFTRDVTERRVAEVALRESEERFRTLLELLPAAVYTCEAPSGKIQFYNRRAAELWGRQPESAFGDERFDGTFRLLKTNRGSSPLEDGLVADILLGGPPVRDQEITVERPDGSCLTILANIDPILDTSGKVVGAVNVFQDMTARKAAEEELRQAKAAAEEANKSKDSFLAVLSHELRTPLTPVLMAASALENDPEISPGVRREIAMMRRNIALETRLIDDLLDLSRIINGKLSLQTSEITVHSLIQNAAEMVSAEAQANHLTVELLLQAEQHRVIGDSARLQQVFWNLLHNAIKFTPNGGRIVIRSRNDTTESLTVEVEDTGIGIDSHVLPVIFNAFAQGEQMANRKTGGLGLGLAIVKAIIDGHDGMISADSKGRHQGSRFEVQLPIAKQSSSTVEKNPDMQLDHGDGAGCRILLVEDHPDTLYIMQHLLRQAGYSVATASSVKAAAEQLDAEVFDLLISDLGLPDGSGVDVIAHARERFPNLPGIALTGYGMEGDLTLTGEAGFNSHLVKPVEIDKLTSAIHALGRNSVK